MHYELGFAQLLGVLSVMLSFAVPFITSTSEQDLQHPSRGDDGLPSSGVQGTLSLVPVDFICLGLSSKGSC